MQLSKRADVDRYQLVCSIDWQRRCREIFAMTIAISLPIMGVQGSRA